MNITITEQEYQELMRVKREHEKLTKLDLNKILNLYTLLLKTKDKQLELALTAKTKSEKFINKLLFWRYIKYKYFLKKILEINNN